VVAGFSGGGGAGAGVSGAFFPHAMVVMLMMTINAAQYRKVRIIYVFSSG
jgi:hypothetical protein